MDFTQTTTTALLEGLRDTEDVEAWRELDERVRPVVFAVARRSGLDSHASADVAQETFVAFMQLYQENRYDRERGRLSLWILGIAKNRIREALRGRAKNRERAEAVSVESIAEDDPLRSLWREELQAKISEVGIQRLLSESRFAANTLRAFKRFCLDGLSAAQVAEETGMTTNAVYMAKHHCMTRLREILGQLETRWEFD